MGQCCLRSSTLLYKVFHDGGIADCRDCCESGFAKGGIAEIFCKQGSIGRCGYLLQLTHQESLVHRVALLFNPFGQSLADITCKGCIILLGYVAHDAVDGILKLGILCLSRRSEIADEHLHTFCAGGSHFANDLLADIKVLCGKLCESVGNDGRRHTVAAVLCRYRQAESHHHGQDQ